MVKQLLIYENATPVSRARHGGLSVKAGGNFGFAAQINSVPLMAAEFVVCPEFVVCLTIARIH